MEQLRLTKTGSIKSLFLNMDEQFQQIQINFLKHITRWQEIASDLGNEFEVVSENPPYGKGTVFGKKYTVKMSLTVPNLKSAECLGCIRVLAAHAVTGEPMEVETYLMTQGLNFFSKNTMTPILMDGSARTEYQVICESIYAVAESPDT
ncbi:hypothetical protein SAMN05216206_2755 [Pseudomonas guineae]|uniref:Uncharacterized protein n=1 Tax=Pseudomonas guineae TaxID=425504 RepID=A0A1I3K993_9PSED|nr:hypothetical protein [Pseudomonas guineae]SFI69053.1 hypothetical protein SAMN05216206_2755 [Pseudomonas guineae]